MELSHPATKVTKVSDNLHYIFIILCHGFSFLLVATVLFHIWACAIVLWTSRQSASCLLSGSACFHRQDRFLSLKYHPLYQSFAYVARNRFYRYISGLLSWPKIFSYFFRESQHGTELRFDISSCSFSLACSSSFSFPFPDDPPSLCFSFLCKKICGGVISLCLWHSSPNLRTSEK